MAVITFAGSEIIGGSLADGNYTLTVRADHVHDADGDPMAADSVTSLYRLFGGALRDEVDYFYYMEWGSPKEIERQAKDDRNGYFRSTLSTAHRKVGEVLLSQGDRGGALRSFRTSIAVLEPLTKTDPPSRFSRSTAASMSSTAT